MTGRKKSSFERGALLAVVAGTLLWTSCGGDAPANDFLDDLSQDAAEEEAPISDGTATLTITGGAARFPGTYEFLVNCNFFGRGLNLTVFPEEPIGRGPEMTSFFLLEAATSFSETVYHGRYDVGESQGDGRILNYFGEADISVTSMSRNSNGFVTADFEVDGRGDDDGLQVTLTAHCLVPGA